MNAKNLFVVLCLFAVLTVKAQTNAPPTPETFFQSAGAYLTSNNTNFTWAGNKLEFGVGADYQNQIQWANDLAVGYDFSDSWQIEGRMRNAGIASTVESTGAGVFYSLVNVYAIKVSAGLEAAYDLQYKCADVEPMLRIRKKLTPNTFAGLYISEPILIQKQAPNNWTPNIGIETGFTF